MRSLRSYFFIGLLKYRHWFKLQWKRDVITWDTSIQDLRDDVERSVGRFGKIPPELEVSPTSLDSPYAEWIQFREREDNKVIMYFHGGGYVMGSTRAHRAIISKFVQGSGVKALSFDYRKAPDDPFPAALDDAMAAYQWLLNEGYLPENIVFVGDSAGAGLCLATLLALKEREMPLPAAAAVLSPWTDLCCSGDSYNRLDPLAPEGSWEVFGAYYIGENDAKNPLISPLYGELEGLPSLFISVGENEKMLDDSRLFAEKAQKAGVEVTLLVGEGMVHCYPALSPFFPEATNAMKSICQFIQSHLEKDTLPPETPS